MYTALASYLFLTTELSAVRLWADFQRIWVLLYWSITLSKKLDAYYEESMFFSIFCYKINSETSFYALSVWETVYENAKKATVRVALICATKPSFSAWMTSWSY